ncbi:hypothetical protein REJC140_00130 [Pseudorhizobium endolithicum]|uniref:Transposase n=1 Tax=Pseudorhizobium endolithicum TaxID=1191678 RepID=A0ABM8PCP2_9HYPH|nr:hypothetical protein [Pseudorhizobium endolithicum]CAD7023211.1 hypothetical protein REJC140_00130 [Pseudorhizobium endolithicum]
MHFYRETGVQSAQIQATGVSLQVGSTIWGIAPNKWFRPGGRGPGGKSGFIGRLIIMAPECSRGLRVAFELRLPWFTIKRIGKASEGHDASSVGWHVARRMCSGVNI